MSDIEIIAVDLGEDIQTIINDEVLQLTAETRERIKTYQAVQVAVTTVKSKRNTEQESINRALQAAYDLILGRGDSGAPVTAVLATVSNMNASAFLLRMKGWLKSRGNEYIIIRDKNYYFLRPWNKEPADPAAS